MYDCFYNAKVKADISGSIRIDPKAYLSSMEALTTEQKYLKQIAEIKWQKGFKCRKCKHKEYYNIKKNFGRRCKNCTHEESAIMNTMFENSKLSITSTFQILNGMQENLVEYLELKKKYFATHPNFNWFEDSVPHENIRKSPESLSKKYEVAENSILFLFQRISDWMKKKNKEGYVEVEWDEGLKDKKSIKAYEALHNFLIYEDEQTPYPSIPTEKMMLEMAVLNKPYFDW